MRNVVWCSTVCGLTIGCGSVGHNNPADAAEPDAAPIDAAIDAPPDAPPDAACEKTLLVGGVDVAGQGWIIYQQQPEMITYGADYTQLTTSTTAMASSGGQLLLARASSVAVDQPFKLEVVMQVVAISSHADDTLDASAGILGSLTGQVGSSSDRAEMVSMYPDRIVWADDAATHAVNIVDGAFHTYVLAVDAKRQASLSLDGAVILTRASYVTNGTVAVGDQSNDAGLDATTRIKQVRLLCVD
ncbi:MAG TPA: hypothetical protein VGC42_15080 [Kofleriaceae bacterium]